LQTRTEDNFVTRARASLTADVREQTSYGTLRAYLAAGWQYSTDDAPTVSLPGTTALASSGTNTFPGSSLNGNLYLLRAFIQWGGFTFGKTASFFDFINTSKYSNQTNQLYQDFGGVGIFTYGYTQQLGNGFAATIAVQDQSPFERPINQFGGTSEVYDFDNGFLPSTSNTAGTLVPDIVGSIRVDQAWGGAQIAAAAHDNRATYYNVVVADGDNPALIGGHPDDKWGFAVQGGIEFNLPWFAQGDTLALQSQYCVGASYYCYNTGGTRLTDVGFGLVNTSTIGLGTITDATFTSATGQDNSLQLSTAWNFVGAIQHYWTPDVRTSLYGIYFSYNANSAAVNTNLCAVLNAGGTHDSIIGSAAVASSGCANWAAWEIGSRTVWNPVKNLDLSVEAMYTDLSQTAFSGARVPVAVPVAQIMSTGDTHIWSGILRIQYNFYP
jgi:hypothetical protein